MLSYAGSGSVVRREHDNRKAFGFLLLEITHADTHWLPPFRSWVSIFLHQPIKPLTCVGIPTNLSRGCQEGSGLMLPPATSGAKTAWPARRHKPVATPRVHPDGARRFAYRQVTLRT